LFLRRKMKITKILAWDNKGEYAIVYVQLEHGDEEYRVYVGGDVEAYHDKGVNKAFVKKAKDNA
jgi:hypothetical protein